MDGPGVHGRRRYTWHELSAATPTCPVSATCHAHVSVPRATPTCHAHISSQCHVSTCPVTATYPRVKSVPRVLFDQFGPHALEGGEADEVAVLPVARDPRYLHNNDSLRMNRIMIMTMMMVMVVVVIMMMMMMMMMAPRVREVCRRAG